MRTIFTILCITCCLFMHVHSQFSANLSTFGQKHASTIDSTMYITVDQPDSLPNNVPFNNGGNYFETAPKNPYPGETEGWYSSISSNYWNGSLRRISNLATKPLDGASANYKISIPETGFYLVYVYMGITTNSTENAIFTVSSLPDNKIIQKVRYSVKDISAGMKKFIQDGLISKSLSFGDGAWMPLTAFQSNTPNAEFLLSIGADSLTNVFLRADAIRLLRSGDLRDIEFGRRERINFNSRRTPEMFPETNLGERMVRVFPFWNLGSDTVSITSIAGSTMRFQCKTVLPLIIPPHSSKDVELEFRPYQEEYIVDSLTIISTDSREPVATLVVAGKGVNYTFILNASDGSEPMWNVPGAPTSRFPNYEPPVYRELSSTWINSVAAPAIYPIHFGNISSRVTRDTTASMQECQFEFTIPKEYEGYYTIGYGGPVSGNASTNITAELITRSTSDTQRVHGFNANNPIYTADYKLLFPNPQNFFIKGDTRMLIRWYAVNLPNAYIRMDLLQIHKIPTSAQPVIANPIMDFGKIEITSPSGIKEVRKLNIENKGESLFRIKNAAFKTGSFFSLLESLQMYREVPAVGSIDLPIKLSASLPGSYIDTLVIETEFPSSVFTVVVKGTAAVTGIEKDNEVLPEEFALSQNYPNPFNPSTVISYQLPVNSMVSLKIYDLLGREIATLVNEEQSAGWKEVEWNGSQFASGIYLLRMQTNNYMETKKIVLMK